MMPTVERTFPSGALNIYVQHRGEFYKRTYFGYTKREALRLFKAMVKNQKLT